MKKSKSYYFQRIPPNYKNFKPYRLLNIVFRFCDINREWYENTREVLSSPVCFWWFRSWRGHSSGYSSDSSSLRPADLRPSCVTSRHTLNEHTDDDVTGSLHMQLMTSESRNTHSWWRVCLRHNPAAYSGWRHNPAAHSWWRHNPAAHSWWRHSPATHSWWHAPCWMI